jgi:peptidoglycan/LPS O-acetylase OafA/YrhL
MSTTGERIPSLDGLRAISIALVVVTHELWGQGIDLNGYYSGNLGVRIFFIISGFLITSILISESERHSTISLRKIYFRRILRIFPAYYFYLLSVFWWYLFAADHSFSVLIPPLTYVTNYMFWVSPWELGHTWSLAVEEQFYLLFPALLLFLGASNIKKLLIFVVIVTPILRICTVEYFQMSDPQTIYRINFYFHNNMDILACGCLLAIYRNELHSYNLYTKFLNSHRAFIGLVFLVPFLGFNSDRIYFFNGLGMTLMNLSIAICIDWLITNNHTMFGKILNSSPFRFVGVLSYSLYLWQQPFSSYSEEQVWTHFPYNLILLISCSLFSYYVIEKTFLQLRKTWEKNIFTKKEEGSCPEAVLPLRRELP